MPSIVDLLDLWPSDQALADTLHETGETIRTWRAAGAVPAARTKELVDVTIREGHMREVSALAVAIAPAYVEAAAILHDLGQAGGVVQDVISVGGRGGHTGLAASITMILDSMKSHRVFDGDPVNRVRSIRAEWDRRDDVRDGIRTRERG